MLRLAHSQNAEIERLVEGARESLVALAQLPPVKAKDAAACNELLARIRENYRAYRALIAADADGNVFCSSVGPGPSIADRAYFQRAMRWATSRSANTRWGAAWPAPASISPIRSIPTPDRSTA